MRGFDGPGKNFSPPGEFEQVGDALHRGRRWAFGQHADDGVRLADTSEPPGADQALSNETFEQRADVIDEAGVGRHARGGVAGAGGDERFVRDDVGVEEEEVQLRQTQSSQTYFDRVTEDRFDIGGNGVTQVAFAGDANARRQPAVEGGANNLLGLAVAVAGCEIEQRDAGGHRVMHGGDTFVECRLAPQHAQAATAQREG